MNTLVPLLEVQEVSKYFGSVIALKDISMRVNAGEVMCLLGDNGAGKSTLIKILSGVHQPSEGHYLVEGKEVNFTSPRDALAAGIATVYQDLAMIPLMSISRNFFLGSEPTKGWGPFRRFDLTFADRTTREEMAKMGIRLRDTTQPLYVIFQKGLHPIELIRYYRKPEAASDTTLPQEVPGQDIILPQPQQHGTASIFPQDVQSQ